MLPVAAPTVYPDLAAFASSAELKWEPFQPGVEIVRLYLSESGASSAFLRYSPGARLRRHTHGGWEHILVLSGSQSDDTGHHQAGAMLIHPPGSSHAIASETGCVVFAMWEKPVRFGADAESEPVASIAR